MAGEGHNDTPKGGGGTWRQWRLEACLSLQCASTKDKEAPVPLCPSEVLSKEEQPPPTHSLLYIPISSLCPKSETLLTNYQICTELVEKPRESPNMQRALSSQMHSPIPLHNLISENTGKRTTQKGKKKKLLPQT